MGDFSSSQEPLIESALREEIVAGVARQVRVFAGFGKCDPEECARNLLSEGRDREQVALLESLAGRSLRELRVLEIGAGYAVSLAAIRRYAAAQAYGIEPGLDDYMEFDLARQVLRAAKVPESALIRSRGENLPFGDGQFDLVFSWNVLEHVDAPVRVLREAFRVLKPGGRLVFNVPNYNSFWEGHYCLPWAPFFNFRPLGRLYLRLLGRDLTLYESLQFTTPAKVRRWIRLLDGRYRLITMGKEVCAKRLRGASFAKWGGLRGVKRAVSALQRLGLAEPAIWVLSLLEAYYPIILVLEKEP